MKFPGLRNGLPRPGEPVGLVAGGGDFPVYVAEAASRRGCRLVVAAVERRENGALKKTAASHADFSISDGGRILLFLKREGVRRVFLAGGLPKKKIYGADFNADALTKKVLSHPGAKGDERLLRAVAAVLGANGIRVLDPAALLEDMVTPRGTLARRVPTEPEMRDVRLGLRTVRGIGRFDIGQTVVVRGGSVVAVEAIEGTDETIRRAGAMGLEGCVVVKAAKPRQDLRFDMPLAGPRTIEAAREARCSVIALEAGRTLIVDRGAATAACDRCGIALIGV